MKLLDRLLRMKLPRHTAIPKAHRVQAGDWMAETQVAIARVGQLDELLEVERVDHIAGVTYEGKFKAYFGGRTQEITVIFKDGVPLCAQITTPWDGVEE